MDLIESKSELERFYLSDAYWRLSKQEREWINNLNSVWIDKGTFWLHGDQEGPFEIEDNQKKLIIKEIPAAKKRVKFVKSVKKGFRGLSKEDKWWNIKVEKQSLMKDAELTFLIDNFLPLLFLQSPQLPEVFLLLLLLAF